MILNLLDNACRHTPPGSTCRAAALRRAARKPWSRSPTTARDTAPSCATQIFDRFVRGDGPADTASGSGSGLGLAIVSAVATSHGGNVEVEEAPGGGALFRVRIPLHRQPAAAAGCGFRSPLATAHTFQTDETQGSAGFSPTAPGGPFFLLPASDLDDDRQDHRPAAQLLVDEAGDRVVQVFLDQV